MTDNRNHSLPQSAPCKNDVLLIDGEQWTLHSEQRLYPKLIEHDDDDANAKQPALSSKGGVKSAAMEYHPSKNLQTAPKCMRVSDNDEGAHNDQLEGNNTSRKFKMRKQSPSRDSSDDEGPVLEAERIMMEVAPGMLVVLRGSSETQKAIRRGTIIQTVCLDCCTSLGVIQDAEFVICPMCRSLTPLAISSTMDHLEGSFGVGLGFEYDDVHAEEPKRLQVGPVTGQEVDQFCSAT